MDDRNFDEKTAWQWIHNIESTKASLRDNDIYPRLNNWLAAGKIKKVLEIGCGQGICSDKIELFGREYKGVDPSETMLLRAIELYADKQRSFVPGNAYSLPFADSTFDGCFSVAVWHLLSDLQKAAQELCRTLKPNGKFLIISANPEAYSVWKSFYKEIKIDGKRLHGVIKLADGTDSFDVLFLHSKKELLSSIEHNGLKVEQVSAFRETSQNFPQMFISIEGQRTY